MKGSTKIAIAFVGLFSTFGLLSVPPSKPATTFKGYKQHAIKKIIAKKNIRKSSVGRTYTGGGSSFGK